MCFTFKLLRISDKGGREKCVIVEAFLPLRMLWALSWGNKKEKGVAHCATPFSFFTHRFAGVTPQQHIKSHLPHFFIPPPPTEYQQFTTCPSSKHKKIAPFIFTFITLAGNEDKHRNQAGITKLRVPRFSTALSFAVPPWLPVGIACSSRSKCNERK